MPTRTVTGTIYDQDGSAATGSVAFRLLESFETSTGVFYAGEHTETLVAGAFSISLGVPDTGTAHYQVTLPGNEWHDFYIAAGAATDLQTILTISGSAVAQDDLQTLMDAASVLTIVTKTGTYVIEAEDEVILCDGTFAVTLPAATGSGKPYLVKNIGTGMITLTAAGSDLIDGAATQTIIASDRMAVIDAVSGKWYSI
jgi:hypothetical protein